MMLGEQHELNDEQKTLFRHSGTMHIFTISGLHIAVIAGGLHAVLSLLRLPRVAQFLAGLFTLWLYVQITGAASSALRALAMISLLQPVGSPPAALKPTRDADPFRSAGPHRDPAANCSAPAFK